MNDQQPFENRYALDVKLGEGTFAEVFRARNLEPDDYIPQDVALKIFKPKTLTPTGRDARFEQEAAIMSRVQHDHIVRVYDARFTAAGDTGYLVMQYIEGEDLETRLHTRRLPWPEARLVLYCLTEALGYLHGQAIIHKDIKPSNIMLDRQGDLAYLLDLGLAGVIGHSNMRTLPERDTQGKRPMPPGTLYYTAPELWEGEAPTVETDLYAFAATAYEMLTGKGLIPDKESISLQELMNRHCEKAPDLAELEQVGQSQLIPVFQKALQKRPEYRFRSVREFYEALLHPGGESTISPTWGLPEVPRNAAVRWETKFYARPEKVNAICVEGAYVWAATDVGMLQWRKRQPLLLTTADGLPHSRVTTLAFNHGNLWIGTAGGLCWGMRPPFKSIRELQGIAIHKVAAAPAGDKIWICLAAEQEIASVDYRGEHFTRHPLAQSAEVQAPTALYVETPDGRRVWIALPDRVIRLDALGREQQVFFAGDRTGFPEGEVLDLIGTQDQHLWVLTSNALATYRGAGEWVTERWAGAPPGTSLSACNNDVWVGSKKGLLHYDATRREARPFLDTGDLQSCAVQRDRVFVACHGQVTPYYPDGQPDEALSAPPAPLDNDIHALVAGVGNVLWVGSRKGVTLLRDGTWTAFPLVTRPSGHRSSWERGPVTALAISTYDQTLFGIVRDRHLLRFEAELWEEIFFPQEVAFIHTLLAGKTGTIWIGTDAGLWQIGPQSRRAERIVSTASTCVRSLAQVGDELWLGTDAGALRLSPAGQLQRENLLAHRILALNGAFDGTVWAGTSEGAFRLANGRWTALPDLRNYDICAITQTRDGALWFGTQQGCLRFDGLGVTSANQANRRLPEDAVRAIAESADGHLWVATKGGLVHFQP